MHSRAAFRYALLHQRLACMKQSLKKRTHLYSKLCWRSVLYVPVCTLIGLSVCNCVKRVRESVTTKQEANTAQAPVVSANSSTSKQTKPQRVNINTASEKELETLPGIGTALAQRIIEYREKYGSFRRAEHLIIIRGMSDARFRALRDLITVQ